MYYYPIESTKIDSFKLKIDAELKNLNTEYKVLDKLKDFEYSGNVFNKRLETQLNKYSKECFGVKKLDEPNYRGETEYNLVNIYMQNEISYSDEKRYSLSINYTGYQLAYNYDNKSSYIAQHSERFRIYTFKNMSDYYEAINGRLESIKDSIDKLKTTKKNLTSLVNNYNKITKQVAEYNDKIPYILNDELRIK